MNKKKIYIIIGVLIFIYVFKPTRKYIIRPLKEKIISHSMATYWPYSGCDETKYVGAKDKYFSQGYEDYILSHVFADVEKGFYVDVGANNPNSASVTLYFHKKGWKGMNFEPQPALYDMLVKYRTEDINIKKAVADNIGEATFYTQSDLSTVGTLDEKIKDIEKSSYETKVEVTTLTHEFTEHNIQNIDFLKIDVEGFEGKVVAGLDLQKFRPKVMVLEYISPTKNNGYVEFEPKILANGYILGMDDGLNRYYYRQEDPEFKERFENIGKCVRTDIWRRRAL